MSKRNVAYIKPQEPNFLTRLKQQAGYKEGPTVDTKREALPQFDDEDFDDHDEDQPVVVVLKPGDLTAEQAEKIKKEEENAPANLDERIVFRKPKQNKGNSNGVNTDSVSSTSSADNSNKKRHSETSGRSESSKKSKKAKETSSSKLLSFDAEDEEET